MGSETKTSREVTHGSNGYFCISDNGRPMIQGEVTDRRREIHVMAGQALTIDKMFGPLIFMPLRVTADAKSGDWIVERMSGPREEWREVARIPGQLPEDFEDE